MGFVGNVAGGALRVGQPFGVPTATAGAAGEGEGAGAGAEVDVVAIGSGAGGGARATTDVDATGDDTTGDDATDDDVPGAAAWAAALTRLSCTTPTTATAAMTSVQPIATHT